MKQPFGTLTRMDDLKRISRLTALLTQLQTKRLVTSTELAKRFDVSVRTIYRDIRALENAGIPIGVEEGKGYFLMEDYRIPPVMFTENEANALITAEQLVLKNKDSSLVNEYSGAIQKIRAVLKYSTKDKAEFLSRRLLVKPLIQHQTTSSSLMTIQKALTDHRVLNIFYLSENQEFTERKIEPFALYNNIEENWMLIAFCCLRKDFRLFRLDRIQKMEVMNETFEPQKMTLEEYIEIQRKKRYTPDT